MALPQFERIAGILHALTHRARRAHLAQVALVACMWLFAWTGVAIILAQFGFVRSGALVWLAAFCSGTVAAAWQLWRTLRPPPKQALRSATLAETLAPELGTSPRAAVQLAESMQQTDVGFSRQLAEEHLRRTAEALAHIDLEARLQAGLRHPQRRIGVGMALAIVWAVGICLALNAGRTRLSSLLVDPRAARLSDVPLAGDIRITYHYPQYTGLAERVVEGGDGSIQAVSGTEVLLQATADVGVRRALLRVENVSGGEAQDVPMEVTHNRQLSAKMPVLRDGRYHFVLVDEGGDLQEERSYHPIRAVLDAFPEIVMDEPNADVELRDNQTVNIRWHAKDDFGISDVTLVIEREGVAEPNRLSIAQDANSEHRDGTYHWAVAELNLPAGKEARFHLEVVDNDVIGGPKKAVSVTRRLVVFSARQHHEDLLAKEQSIIDALVDVLAADLEAPFPSEGGKALTTALQAHGAITGLVAQLLTELNSLLDELRQDRLSKPEVVAAFNNVLEHVDRLQQERVPWLTRLSAPSDDHVVTLASKMASVQRTGIKQVEKDIIYLDDLLAISRIEALKNTAKELLAAQHDLQGLLQEYKQTQDPALREQLKERIADLRQKMMDLLTKMGSIKKALPGEYRNMESGSMVKLDDQLNRLQKMLESNDLDAAAQELEGLANMVENMVNSIGDAEQEYGGDRYKEVREQLAEFADKFKRLESEQKALSQRTDELVKDYRNKAIERAGKNLDGFVQKAREKTRKALQELDRVAENPDVARLFDRDIDSTRQGLLDLDALLAHRDFAEARQIAQNTLLNSMGLQNRLAGGADDRAGDSSQDAFSKAAQASRQTAEHTHDVVALLDKLFPEADQVLGGDALNQLQNLAKKEQSLEQQAKELAQKMESMAGELPLFGGESRATLEGARGEMAQAARDISEGELPGGAGHGRRALDQLSKLRESLQKSAKGGGQGLPLPLGGSQSGQTQGNGPGADNSHEEVEIPKVDRNRATPRFRQDLLEAAKQKPPAHFEDAVRRYYEELIR